MSVSRGVSDEYRDYDWTHYRGTFRANSADPNDTATIQDVAELAPAGGIDRREEAELVALMVHHVHAETDPTTLATAPDGGRLGFELSRDEDPGPLTQFRTEVDLQFNAREGNDLGTNVLSRQTWENNPDVIWYVLGRWDSTGNGRQNFRHGPEHIFYRDVSGTGPVFTSGDDLHIHGRVNLVNAEDNFVGDLQFTAVWDVRERN